MKRLRPTVFVTLLVAPLAAAHGQSIDSTTPAISPAIASLFARNRSVAVSDRTTPGYERTGVRVGSFVVRPDVLVAGFYSDNLFATETNRQDDVAIVVAPQVNAVLEASHTRVTLGASTQFSRYLSSGTENSTVFDLRAAALHDLGAGFTVGANAGFQRQAERRSDPGAINTSVRPILFTIARVGGDLGWESGRVRVRALGSYIAITFRDGRLANGAVLPQGYRERSVYRMNGIADYALTPNVALRLQANYAKSEFKDKQPLDRSSSRIELLGGVSFEFTDLLRGEIGVGYLDQKFDSPAFRPFSGIGGRAQIEYLATPLTSITLRASRTIEESGLPEAPTYVRTSATLGIDHELYRNLIISGYAGYSKNRFRQPDRSDERPSFGASATFRASQNISVIARYDYLDVNAHPRGSGRSLTLNSASVGLNIGI